MNDLSRLPVTFGLISACVVVYVAVAIAGQSYGYPLNVGLVTQPPEVLAQGALVPAAVAQGQVWLLLSSMFLHSGFIHLALNMLSLYFLGSFVEQAFGKSRFLALYFSSGLAGGIAYLYFGFSVSNISNTAHIGGLVGGAAFGWLAAPTVYSGKKLRVATPTIILFGAELSLLAIWFFFLIPAT